MFKYTFNVFKIFILNILYCFNQELRSLLWLYCVVITELCFRNMKSRLNISVLISSLTGWLFCCSPTINGRLSSIHLGVWMLNVLIFIFIKMTKQDPDASWFGWISFNWSCLSPFSLILFLKLTSFTGLCLKDVWQHHSSQYQLIQWSLLQLHEAKDQMEKSWITFLNFFSPIVFVLSLSYHTNCTRRGLLKEVIIIILSLLNCSFLLAFVLISGESDLLPSCVSNIPPLFSNHLKLICILAFILHALVLN